MTENILITGSSVEQDLLLPLSEAGYDLKIIEEDLDEESLADALEGVTGYLFGGDETVTGPALRKASGLRVISFLGVGWESFMDVSAVRERGISVTNTPGTLSASVAELTVGLLLDATRKISYLATNPAAHPEKARELSSMKIGIVGLGSIGSMIARILRLGFGSQVAYNSRTRKISAEEILEVKYMDLHELARWADALIVMTTANESTRGLIGASVLDEVHEGTILVNTSKPPVVDSSALLDSLRSEKLSIACFDGFYGGEDPNRVNLMQYGVDRLIITPHLGSLTGEARNRMGAAAVGNLLSFLSGERVLDLPLRGSR